MAESRKSIRVWLIGAAAWAVAVTAIMAWPLLYPPVEPKGASFREDTFGLEMFDMKGDGYVAIEQAVTAGSLVVHELSEGFRLYTIPSMTRLQQSRRVKTAEQIVAKYVGEQRQSARIPLAALWAALALALPLLTLGAVALALGFRPGQGGAGPLPRPTG